MGELTAFGVPMEGWMFAGAVLFCIIILLWIAALVKIGKLKKRLDRFVSDTGMPDLESVIRALHERMEEMAAATKELDRRVAALESKTADMKANVGFLRYNAFGDRGNDLSFSVAMVDDRMNGVVISSLHSRDESRMYAKPIDSGASSYPLTPEEKQAISLATRKL